MEEATQKILNICNSIPSNLIEYEIASSKMWIGVAAIIILFFLICTVIAVKKAKDDSDYYVITAIFIGIILIFTVVVLKEVSDIFEASFCPDKIVIEYVADMLREMQ